MWPLGKNTARQRSIRSPPRHDLATYSRQYGLSSLGMVIICVHALSNRKGHVLVAGEQYFSITKSLLALSEPLQSAPTWGLTNRESIIPCIRDEALRVCGLAYTNDDIAARVNAFGPLAFCVYFAPSILRE